jgi:hypothetical protein
MNGDQGAGDADEPQDPEKNGSGSQVEACSYISETLADLVAIAANHRLHTLRYLLHMARLEADEIVRSSGPEGT